MANANGRALLSMMNCRARLLSQELPDDDRRLAFSLMEKLSKCLGMKDRIVLFSATSDERAGKTRALCDFLGINFEAVEHKIYGDTEGHQRHHQVYYISLSDLQEALRKSS